MDCPLGMHYSTCGSPCNVTCTDLTPVCALACVPRCECAESLSVWFPDLGQCAPQSACLPPPGLPPPGLPPGLPPAVSVSPSPPPFDCPKLQPAQGASCSAGLPDICAYGVFQCPNSSFVTNTTLAVCDASSATWLLAAVLPVCPEPPKALTKAAFQASPSRSTYGATYTVGLLSAGMVVVCAAGAMCLCRGRPTAAQEDAKPLLQAISTSAASSTAVRQPWTFRSLSPAHRP